MTDTGRQTDTLVPLRDTDLTVANPAADIRGRDVLDRDGNKIGKVDDLLIDTDERQVRFLKVAHGGFLGIGEDHFLVPVDAVEAVDDDTVRVNRSRQELNEAPGYNPDLTVDNDYYTGLYGWWGYPPYWSAGYVYPPFPGGTPLPR